MQITCLKLELPGLKFPSWKLEKDRSVLQTSEVGSSLQPLGAQDVSLVWCPALSSCSSVWCTGSPASLLRDLSLTHSCTIPIAELPLFHTSFLLLNWHYFIHHSHCWTGIISCIIPAVKLALFHTSFLLALFQMLYAWFWRPITVFTQMFRCVNHTNDK